jgi:hypothetical protein
MRAMKQILTAPLLIAALLVGCGQAATNLRLSAPAPESSAWSETCTRTLADAEQATVQRAVNRVATNGTATICIPAASATWGSRVTWTNKNIYLKGAGVGQTVISNTGVQRSFDSTRSITPTSRHIHAGLVISEACGQRSIGTRSAT